jgi:hypothetical protein
LPRRPPARQPFGEFKAPILTFLREEAPRKCISASSRPRIFGVWLELGID